jgi:diguanylate cyclase (GGDEF)-like protein
MHDDASNRRILIVAQRDAIHRDVRSILTPPSELEATRPRTTGGVDSTCSPASRSIRYDVDAAYESRAGLDRVREACGRGRPFALAFVDVGSPPDWDGIHTVRALHNLDANLQVAICTADADQSGPAILSTLGLSDSMLMLKTPIDAVELQQLAFVLTEKWRLEHSLAEANAQLAQEAAARQQSDDRIRYIAFHDALTDLPNRTLLMERIEHCIERSRRREQYRFAVLYCDLDNFKLVNDSLGHRIGDQLLVQVARKLNHALRTASNELRPAFDMVARLSGDEFVILLDDVPDQQHVRGIAERVQEAILQPIQVEENSLVLGISIGVATSAGEYDDPIDLLRDADTALYHAKDCGKGCIAFFDQEMRAKACARLDLETDLRRAIEQQQFEVYYQPIVALASGDVVGVEALVRWLHPTHGVLLPAAFMPVADETGLIDAIGEVVLKAAVDQVAHWRKSIPGMERLTLNINLSPRQLVHHNVIDHIDSCLALYQLDPGALRVEVTESAMLNDLAKIRRVLGALVARGVEIQLDDFGTGYSSLNILHTLPFSAVKLDRSFISNLADELENPTAVTAIVVLAQHENIKVVAEGIESHDQLTQLRQLNCEFGQGYYFSRPLPAAEIASYLANSASGVLSPPAGMKWPADSPVSTASA